MKLHFFNSAVFTLIVGALVAMPVFAQCPEGKTEILMTTPSGITKVRCVNDKAVTGIENAADHAVIEIATACPCWTEEELGIYDAKIPTGLVCDEKEKFPGEMYCDEKLGVAEFLLETTFANENYLCIDQMEDNPDEPGKAVITALEYNACNDSLINLDPYSPCPCWSEKELTGLGELECVESSTADGLECYDTYGKELLAYALTYSDGTNQCMAEIEDGRKIVTSDLKHQACVVSLEQQTTTP